MGTVVWAVLVLPLLTWAAATFGGALASRLGQPAFVGHLLAGVVLGPTFWMVLHPKAGIVAGHQPLSMLAEIGLALMVAEAGRHLNLDYVRRSVRQITILVIAGFGLPFAVGAAAAGLVPSQFVPHGVRPSAFAVLLGVAMAMSALPILWATLQATGLQHWPVAHLLVAAVVIGDLGGWLALAWAQSDAGLLGPLQVLAAMGATAVVAIVAAAAAAALGRRSRLFPGLLGVLVVLGVAEIAVGLGCDRVLGAFLAGMALSRSKTLDLPSPTTDRTLVPLFFAWTTAQVDFAVLGQPVAAVMTVAVVLVAVSVKFAGGGLGALLCGLSRREAVAVGAGLNCRGAVEIAIGLIGLESGLIGPELFAALVAMAVVTSVMTPAALRAALGPHPSVVTLKPQKATAAVPDVRPRPGH